MLSTSLCVYSDFDCTTNTTKPFDSNTKLVIILNGLLNLPSWSLFLLPCEKSIKELNSFRYGIIPKNCQPSYVSGLHNLTATQSYSRLFPEILYFIHK